MRAVASEHRKCTAKERKVGPFRHVNEIAHHETWCEMGASTGAVRLRRAAKIEVSTLQKSAFELERRRLAGAPRLIGIGGKSSGYGGWVSAYQPLALLALLVVPAAVVLWWRRGRHLSPAARAFVDFARSHSKARPGRGR